jgi:anti-sigma regulatory factor (Ser/Thr protein kinase)
VGLSREAKGCVKIGLMAVDLEQIAVDSGEHVVQFYEDDSQLARTVGAHLTRALRDGAVAVVIATEAHRHLFTAELEAAGLDPAVHSLAGTLVLLDAATTMAGFVDDGQVDHEAFRRIVGSVIREAAATGRPIRAYGEMVALLWDAGDVLGAIELEKAWNALARELPFSLVCAYPSQSVSGHEHADALHEVCALHTSVIGASASHAPAAAPEASHADFAADLQAPASARHFVAGVLEHWGHSRSLLDDAALVVTELATNAVIHACSPFSVEVRTRGGRVRLSIRDNSRASPCMREHAVLRASGRGLRIVDAISASWGVETANDGKTVWAELQA